MNNEAFDIVLQEYRRVVRRNAFVEAYCSVGLGLIIGIVWTVISRHCN